MADVYSTTTNNSSVMWSYFHRKALDVVQPMLAFDQLGDNAPLPQKYGKQAIWTKFRKLTPVTSAGTEGVSPDLIAITSAQVTGLVQQYKNAVGYTDALLAMGANDGLEKIIEELVAENVARSIDIICRTSLESAIGTTIYAGGVSALSALGSTMRLTLPLARQAKNTLEANNVGAHKSGYYPFVGHVNTIYDMVTDTAAGGWIDMHKYNEVGAERLYNAEVGECDQIKFIKTTLVSSTTAGTSGGATAYTNMIFGYQPFGSVKLDGYSFRLIHHKPGSSGVADPTDEKGSVAWKIWYVSQYFGAVTAVADPDRAIKVVTSASA